MTTEKDERNVVELQKVTANNSVYIKIISNDLKTKELVDRAKKEFDDMWAKDNKPKTTMESG